MTRRQQLRMTGILHGVYLNACSKLKFKEQFAHDLIEALAESGFKIVADIHVEEQAKRLEAAE